MSYSGHLNPATGLYIQPMLEMLVEHEVARVRRYPGAVALVRVGMHAGDMLSAAAKESARDIVAQVLNANLRQVDVPGHYENDFVALLPVTDEADAAVVGTRLLRFLRGTQFARDGSQYELAACAGVAAYVGSNAVSASELFVRAAVALKEARRRGPHVVVKFSELY